MTPRDDDVVLEDIRFPLDGSRVEQLAGTLAYPASQRPALPPVLVLPPHPNFGGDRRNNVVRSLVQAIAASGRVVLVPDYHGLGGGSTVDLGETSLIDHWADIETRRDHGLPVRDALAARAALARAAGEGVFASVGYSYGSIVESLAFGADAEVERRVWIGPPWTRHTFKAPVTGAPHLVLAGAEDFLHDAAEASRIAVLAGVRMASIESADHFLRGHEDEAARLITGFLDERAR